MNAAQIEAAFSEAGIRPLSAAAFRQFEIYLELLLRWNQRLSLTSIREPKEIIQRHFIESAFAAEQLPIDIGDLLDYGSGAGLPGLPIAICRPDVQVLLAEAQGKKASFLFEALRVIGLAGDVYGGRVEDMPTELRFDAVCMRAVEKMEFAIPVAVLRAKRYLVLLTTRESARAYMSFAPGLNWQTPVAVPNSNQRVVAVGQRA